MTKDIRKNIKDLAPVEEECLNEIYVEGEMFRLVDLVENLTFDIMTIKNENDEWFIMIKYETPLKRDTSIYFETDSKFDTEKEALTKLYNILHSELNN